MAAKGSTSVSRKQLILSALCKHFSLDPKSLPENIAGDEVTSLYSTVLKSAKHGTSAQVNDGVVNWVRYAEGFPTDSQACSAALEGLNETLADVSVLLGNGFTPSEADAVVFSAVHSSVIGLSNTDRQKLPHLLRWVDYIQNKVDFGDVPEKIAVEKDKFDFRKLDELLGAKSAGKVEIDSNAKKTVQSTKTADKLGADLNTKKSDAGVKAAGEEKVTSDTKADKKATNEKTKSPETEAVEKDKEVSVSLLNIQVGLVRKAWKHPSADSLLVEEIDVGEAKLRQVVSGLAKYISPEELTNRHVVLITNVKPGKLRDVMSQGLVLCASNEDHTLVEPLLPPQGAKPGERVSFSGIDGKPEDVLNPKKETAGQDHSASFHRRQGRGYLQGYSVYDLGWALCIIHPQGNHQMIITCPYNQCNSHYSTNFSLTMWFYLFDVKMLWNYRLKKIAFMSLILLYQTVSRDQFEPGDEVPMCHFKLG